MTESSAQKMTGLKDTREPSQVNCFYQSNGKPYIFDQAYREIHDYVNVCVCVCASVHMYECFFSLLNAKVEHFIDNAQCTKSLATNQK